MVRDGTDGLPFEILVEGVMVRELYTKVAKLLDVVPWRTLLSFP